jgi:hypothetical protein
METASTVLTAWSNFYVMTGSSAAALTGLMFVVITLVAGLERAQPSHEGMATFSSPTVLHFGAALLVSAILCAPWHSLLGVAMVVGFAGLYGVLYLLRVTIRARRLTLYTPDLEDWIWYTIAPFVAYGTILASAIALPAFPVAAPFALAGSVLLLIFIGIRNAWDIVTYLAVKIDDEPAAATSSDGAE